MCKVKNNTFNSKSKKDTSTKNIGFQSVKPIKHSLLDKLELLDERNSKHSPFFIKYRKRAYAKHRTMGFIDGLIELNNVRREQYDRTKKCGCLILQEGKKFTSRYCGYRWCILCSRIKSGKIIREYLNPMSENKDWYHVTLTLKNVEGKDLRKTNKLMFKIFSNIMRRIKYRNKVKATRTIECTYNPIKNDFHPHMHVLITGEENANYLKENWIYEVSKHYGMKVVEGIGSEVCLDYLQKVDKVTDTERALKEVLKYPTKHFDDNENAIPSLALDTIYHSFENLRTFQVYGMRAMDDKIEEQETEDDCPYQYETMLWVWRENDWINFEGVALSGYDPDKHSKIEQNST